MNELKMLRDLVLFFIPRFINDHVALCESEDGSLQVLCGVEFLPDHMRDDVKAYGYVKVFTWFGQSTGGECHIYEEVA